jgi:acetate kinase
LKILVVNAGSSSLKLRVLDEADRVIASADLSTPSGEAAAGTLTAWVGENGPVDAVGHRVVHGGSVYTGPVVIDREVVEQLRALTDLAPLHQPRSLAGIDAVAQVLPDLPTVACFDTAFHAGLPAAAATYAIPAAWRERWELRRYGFHGLSHGYASRRAAELTGRPAEGLRIVTCHLGSGASLAAVVDGRSVDTTMGFTPLEGLVMATRSGSVDPGLILWLEEHAGLAPADLARTLEHGSGLLALAGTADMGEVLARAEEGDEKAGAALDVYLHSLRGGVSSMAAAAGGLDVLVFTGGVGENAPEIRRRSADGLSFLGVGVDPERNTAHGDRDVSAAGAGVTTLVIEAREDLEIARQVRAALG